MQDIAEKLKSFTGQAGESIGKGLDVLKDKASQAGDYLQANPTVAAMLLAGGGAGLLGGNLTSQQEEEESESKSQRRGRILRNALLSAAAGAGAVGLGAAGYNRLAQATPAGSLNPVTEKLTNPFTRGLGGLGLGVFGYNRGMKADLEDLKNQALKTFNKEEFSIFSGKDPKEVLAYVSNPKNRKNFNPKADKITDFVANLKGNVNDPRVVDYLSKVLGRNRAAAIAMQLGNKQPEIDKAIPKIQSVLNKILGTSRAGRYARLGGLGGVFLPEIASGAKDLFSAAGDL